MPDHATETIRNIALAGHAGAGKSALSEALLGAAGAVAQPGSIEQGTTVTDASVQEKVLHHSVSATILGLEWQDCRVNLIDTPGYPDFLGQALSVMAAAESVAVVVSAQAGVEQSTRTAMDWARERGLCRMIVVNKVDADGVDLPAVLASIQAAFGTACLPLNLPAQAGTAVADCFFQPAGDCDFSSVAAAHDRLVDQVIEVDEALMALYLEQGEEVRPEQLHAPFEQALREGHLIPVCFTSAKTGAGVPELLDAVARLMPNPLEGNPPPFIREDEDGVSEFHAESEPAAHVLAHVVKVEHDPFAGKLSVFRVHQGTIGKDSRLYVGDGSKPFKVNNLYRLQGANRVEVSRCIPGDICAVAKVDETHFDAVLHDSHDEDHIRLRPMALPTPVFGKAVRPQRHRDEHKLSEVLAKLVDEDPGLAVEHNTVTHETDLRGLGELHLSVTLEKMQQRFNVEVETSPPSIAYRETITAPAEGHYRHKKQSGGAGQFGEVFLNIEPLPRNDGFEFVDRIRGGAIPSGLLVAVEKGIREAMASGAIAGYPIQDVRVTVYDGKTHSVDSKEVAFVIAGRRAFLDAVGKASPVVLEPLVAMAIDAPASNMGDITGDLSARRGRIQDTSSDGDRVRIQALAPMAELEDYPSRLKAMTGGAGSHTLQFSHYEPAPGNVQKQLMAAYKPEEDTP